MVLIINSVSFIIANFATPSFSLKIKTTLELSAIGYVANYLLNYLSTFGFLQLFVMSIGSIFGGIGAGMLAVAFNGYINMICVKNKCEEKSGKYFGIFNTITSSCFIFGSLISTFSFVYF
jgi:hypothetical protein